MENCLWGEGDNSHLHAPKAPKKVREGNIMNCLFLGGRGDNVHDKMHQKKVGDGNLMNGGKNVGGIMHIYMHQKFEKEI